MALIPANLTSLKQWQDTPGQQVLNVWMGADFERITTSSYDFLFLYLPFWALQFLPFIFLQVAHLVLLTLSPCTRQYERVYQSLCASWLQSSVSCYTCKGSFIVSQKASSWATWQMWRICAAVIKIRGLIKLCNLHSLPLSFTRAYQITLVMRMAINCWQRNSCASEVWAPDAPKWQ